MLLALLLALEWASPGWVEPLISLRIPLLVTGMLTLCLPPVSQQPSRMERAVFMFAVVSVLLIWSMQWARAGRLGIVFALCVWVTGFLMLVQKPIHD